MTLPCVEAKVELGSTSLMGNAILLGINEGAVFFHAVLITLPNLYVKVLK